MSCAESGEARRSPGGGAAPAGCLPSQRAAGPRHHRLSAVQPTLPLTAGPADGVADTAEGAGGQSGALWLSTAARAAATGGLAGEHEADLAALLRGRLGDPATAAAAPARLARADRPLRGRGTERGVGNGLHVGWAFRWPFLPVADGGRLPHARGACDSPESEFRAFQVVEMLDRLARQRGKPRTLKVDNVLRSEEWRLAGRQVSDREHELAAG